MTPPRWLVAHDFSPCADAALELAAEELQGREGSLLLVHCYELGALPFTASTAYREADISPWREMASWMLEDRAARLKAVAEEVEERWPAVEVETRCMLAPAAEGILDAAAEMGIERIVVGTHGRKGLAHVFLGSVAGRVARLAPVPVLVVKAPPTTVDVRRVVSSEPSQEVSP